MKWENGECDEERAVARAARATSIASGQVAGTVSARPGRNATGTCNPATPDLSKRPCWP